MHELFATTYALTTGIILLESLVIQEITRRAVATKEKFLEPLHHHTEQLPTGTPAPEFSAAVLGSDLVFRKCDLIGRDSILLFVSATALAELGHSLITDVHVLWHKAKGRFWVLCNGQPEMCSQIVAFLPGEHHLRNQIRVALDQGGQIARSFRVFGSPEAVELNANAEISRYGRKESIRKAWHVRSIPPANAISDGARR